MRAGRRRLEHEGRVSQRGSKQEKHGGGTAVVKGVAIDFLKLCTSSSYMRAWYSCSVAVLRSSTRRGPSLLSTMVRTVADSSLVETMALRSLKRTRGMYLSNYGQRADFEEPCALPYAISMPFAALHA